MHEVTPLTGSSIHSLPGCCNLAHVGHVHPDLAPRADRKDVCVQVSESRGSRACGSRLMFPAPPTLCWCWCWLHVGHVTEGSMLKVSALLSRVHKQRLFAPVASATHPAATPTCWMTSRHSQQWLPCTSQSRLVWQVSLLAVACDFALSAPLH
jgi:hypothetical protein